MDTDSEKPAARDADIAKEFLMKYMPLESPWFLRKRAEDELVAILTAKAAAERARIVGG